MIARSKIFLPHLFSVEITLIDPQPADVETGIFHFLHLEIFLQDISRVGILFCNAAARSDPFRRPWFFTFPGLKKAALLRFLPVVRCYRDRPSITGARLQLHIHREIQAVRIRGIPAVIDGSPIFLDGNSCTFLLFFRAFRFYFPRKRQRTVGKPQRR